MSGIEWVVDASGCLPRSLSDVDVARKLFDQIVHELQLHPIAEAHWHQFPETGRITGVCMLAESHLAFHTFPEHGSMCLNLFSGVPRSACNFREILERHFGATSVTVRQLTRIYKVPRAMAATD